MSGNDALILQVLEEVRTSRGEQRDFEVRVWDALSETRSDVMEIKLRNAARDEAERVRAEALKGDLGEAKERTESFRYKLTTGLAFIAVLVALAGSHGIWWGITPRAMTTTQQGK